MNSSDHRLDRLLESAQRARLPMPVPSPWLEQRVVLSLKAGTMPSSHFIESWFIFRILAGATVLMAASLILPLTQVKNPYLESLELVNSTVQWEKIP